MPKTLNLSQAKILEQCKKYIAMQLEIDEEREKEANTLEPEIYKKKYDRKFRRKYHKKDIEALDSAFQQGHCYGLAAYWLFRKDRGEDSLFFGDLGLIAEWNGSKKSLLTEDLEPVFERTINNMRWLHASHSLDNHITRQSHLEDVIEFIKPASHEEENLGLERGQQLKSLTENLSGEELEQFQKQLKQFQAQRKLPHLRREFGMSFVFKKEELITTLRNALRKGKMLQIGSTDHSIGVYQREGKIYCYDSNQVLFEFPDYSATDTEKTKKARKTGETVLTTVEELADYLEKSLFKAWPESSDTTNNAMPIHIAVLDRSDKTKEKYQLEEKLMREFLDSHGDVNRKSWDDWDIMDFALKGEDLTALKVVLSYPAFSRNRLCTKRDSGLHEVMRAYSTFGKELSLTIMKILCDFGCNLEITNKEKRTPLQEAVMEDCLPAVELLCKYGANKEALTKNGNSLLHLAIIQDNPEMLRLLCRLGANTEIQDIHNDTALQLAVKENKIEMVGILCEAGANKDVLFNGRQNFSNGQSLLHYLVFKNQTQLLKELCERGANLEIKDRDGLTPLQYAVLNDFPAAARVLCQAGANPHVLLPNRESLIHFARDGANHTMIRILESKESQEKNAKDVTLEQEDGFSLTPLQKAVLDNNLAAVASLCKHGANKEVIFKNRKTLLQHAVTEENYNLVKVLCEQGANVNASYAETELPPLLLAVSRGNVEIAELLCKRAANKELTATVDQPPYKKTALQLALSKKDYRMLEMLLKNQGHGASNPNMDYDSRQSFIPLFEAINSQDYKALSLLCEMGVNTEILDSNRMTPLQFATTLDDLEAIRILAKAKADLNVSYSQIEPPLFMAISGGDVRKVDLLCQLGARLDIKDESRQTPIQRALTAEKPEILEILIRAGAKTEVLFPGSNTLLHQAVLQSNPTLLEVLLRSKMDLEALNDNEETPLHLAISRNDIEMVAMLCEQRANKEALNREERTALQEAVMNGRLEIVKILCEAGANMQVLSPQKRTLLQLAIHTNNIPILEMLCQYGADINNTQSEVSPPLLFAAEHDAMEAVEILLERGALSYLLKYAPEKAEQFFILMKSKEKSYIINEHFHLYEKDTQEQKNTKEYTNILLKHAKMKNFETVKFLLTRGLFSKLLAQNSATAKEFIELLNNNNKLNLLQPEFQAAIINNNLEVIEFLAGFGLNLDNPLETSDIPLHYATKQKNPALLKLICDLKADPNALDFHSRTALQLAILENDIDSVKILCEAGADLELTTGTLPKPIFLALDQNRLEIFKYLLQQGAELESSQHTSGDQAQTLTVLQRLQQIGRNDLAYLVKKSIESERMEESASKPRKIKKPEPKVMEEIKAIRDIEQPTKLEKRDTIAAKPLAFRKFIVPKAKDIKSTTEKQQDKHEKQDKKPKSQGSSSPGKGAG